jgi:hypothetical protein
MSWGVGYGIELSTYGCDPILAQFDISGSKVNCLSKVTGAI